MNKKDRIRYRISVLLIGIIFLEFLLAGFLSIPFFGEFVSGGVGEDVTVITTLEVGAVYPEILNLSINYGNSITLIANSTKRVDCVAVVRDYNNDTDITYAGAELFDSVVSSEGTADDNNNHYSNFSCYIDYNFGSYNTYNDDNYTALVNCTFDVEYYANPQIWVCAFEINDTTNRADNSSDTETLNELMAIGLDDSINYGIVNSTEVSSEQISNVTNVGNTLLNLTLSGYAQTEGDGYAMNCTLGDNSVFNVYYEKYNLTESTSGDLSLSEFENNYINLTASPVVNAFGLIQRQDDLINDATNATHWRIYVPRGVAGTCDGNIVFGATTAGA